MKRITIQITKDGTWDNVPFTYHEVDWNLGNALQLMADATHSYVRVVYIPSLESLVSGDAKFVSDAVGTVFSPEKLIV